MGQDLSLSLYRLADLVGFGVAVATGYQYLQSFPERCYKTMLIPSMLEDKRGSMHKLVHSYIWGFLVFYPTFGLYLHIFSMFHALR